MMACNLRLRFAYLPSGSNPADAPSGGKRPKKLHADAGRRQKIPVKQPSAAVKLVSHFKETSRALERCMNFNDDIFSYDIGQPASTDASFTSHDDHSSLIASSHGGVGRDIGS